MTKKILCLVLVLCLVPVFALADSKDVLNTEGELPIVKEPVTMSIFVKQGAIHAEWSTMDFFKKYQELTESSTRAHVHIVQPGEALDFK